MQNEHRALVRAKLSCNTGSHNMSPLDDKITSLNCSNARTGQVYLCHVCFVFRQKSFLHCTVKQVFQDHRVEEQTNLNS